MECITHETSSHFSDLTLFFWLSLSVSFQLNHQLLHFLIFVAVLVVLVVRRGQGGGEMARPRYETPCHSFYVNLTPSNNIHWYLVTHASVRCTTHVGILAFAHASTDPPSTILGRVNRIETALEFRN